MNDYKICYVNDNGETACGFVTERSESAAVKAFKKERNLKEVGGIEMVRENVPATKAQEREALAAIQQLLADLGPGSYLAAAFEGCCEDAENNIEYDFGDSMKARYESAKEEADCCKEQIQVLTAQCEAAESKLKSVNTGVEELIQKDDERKAACEQLRQQLDEARAAAGDAQRRAEAAELETMRLKAKLYDYITMTA